MASLSLVSLIVRDYDEAIAFYTDKLGFVLREDTLLGPDKRWVIVSPASGGAGILLAKAKNAAELAAVGKQAGGRVFLFLETDDFHRDHGRMVNAGVTFREVPRHETYGIVAVFEDLYGNLFDLVERTKS
jgi:catechol 2,3-dioxygenase-like lactoylglutathione lyase family enzyme